MEKKTTAKERHLKDPVTLKTNRMTTKLKNLDSCLLKVLHKKLVIKMVKVKKIQMSECIRD